MLIRNNLKYYRTLTILICLVYPCHLKNMTNFPQIMHIEKSNNRNITLASLNNYLFWIYFLWQQNCIKYLSSTTKEPMSMSFSKTSIQELFPTYNSKTIVTMRFTISWPTTFNLELSQQKYIYFPSNYRA
jgi:hypothetical protein